MSTYLPNLHESWLLGDPEINVHVYVKNGSGVMVPVSCAGGNRSAPYYFDQNNNSWSGTPVKLIEASALLNKEYEVQIWEDDHNECDGTNDLEPYSDANVIGDIILLARTFYGEVQDVNTDSIWDVLKALKNLGKASYDFATGGISDDDFVGTLKELTTTCYMTDTGPVYFNLIDSNDNNAGSGYIGNTEDVDRELCPPPPAMNVTINGPLQVPPSATEACTWTAITNSGPWPVDFEWKWDNSVVSYSQYYSPFGGLSNGFHTLVVSADNSFSSAADTIYVEVDSSYSCPT